MDNKKLLLQLEELKKYSGNMRLAAEKWKNDYETLVSIILSARTRDETTIKVCKKLFSKYPSIKKLSGAKLKDVEKIINPVNFYKNKARNIIGCAEKLKEEFSSEVPQEFEKLITLPGVGRKTANVFLGEKGHNTIGVDTHVSYISSKLRWTKEIRPEKIEQNLKKIFPRDKHKEINPILVRFGKTFTSKKQKNIILEKIKKLS